MNLIRTEFIIALIFIVSIYHCPSTTHASKYKTDARQKLHRIPLNVLASEINERKGKDPRNQGNKPRQDPSHDSKNPGCNGRNCGKSPSTCNGKNCRNQGAQCGKDSCKTDQECIRRTRGKCSFCVSRRCTSRRPKINVGSKESTRVISKDSTRTIRRFTKVARRYSWHPGRPRETRPPGFAQCIIKTCDSDADCRRIRGKRQPAPKIPRKSAECLWCGKTLNWGKKTCGHFREGDERWIPNIEEKVFNDKRGGVLTIPDGTAYPGGIPRFAGELMYRRATKSKYNKQERIWLDNIRVVTKYQSKRMGKALMKHFLDKIVKEDNKDIQEVKLLVYDGPTNEPAIRLYKGLGFQYNPLEDLENYYMTLNLKNYVQPTPVDVSRED